MNNNKERKLDRRENVIAFLFILPPIIGFLIFTIGAMLFSFKYSFEDYNILTGVSQWKGLENYRALFSNVIFSESFLRSISNTVILLASVPISMILGLVLAGLLKAGGIKCRGVFQVLYYIPAVSSAVALNIVWRYIFNNEFGVLNALLGKKIPWLSDDNLIKVAIITKNSLNGIGSAMILYLAGMLNVPKDYYEASELDGANKVRQFFSITLPLITPVTFYQLTLLLPASSAISVCFYSSAAVISNTLPFLFLTNSVSARIVTFKF